MSGPRRGGRARRIAGLMRKEWLQVMRDPSSILIAFVMPVILLLIFGYGVSLDAKHVRLALVVEASSQEAQSLAGSFQHSVYFDTTVFRDRQSAQAALQTGAAQGILVIRADFARRIRTAADSPLQLILNGTDSNSARIIQGYVDGAWAKWLAVVSASERLPITVPVTAEPRVWFNPGVRSQDFLVPGLIAIIMTLIGALLTALVIAREWDRGTMETLIVSPARPIEIFAGKIGPYFVLGMGAMALSTAMAVFLFDVPLTGSVWALTGISALFMLAALGMGLFISSVAKNQFVASQAAIIGTFLPAFILSGFIFDIASMPPVVQWITHVIPARYFVSSLQTLFLAGDVWSILLPDAAALAVIATVFIGLALRSTRMRLE